MVIEVRGFAPLLQVFDMPKSIRLYRDMRSPPKVAWYGMKQLYLKDPDGFGVCFQWKA